MARFPIDYPRNQVSDRVPGQANRGRRTGLVRFRDRGFGPPPVAPMLTGRWGMAVRESGRRLGLAAMAAYLLVGLSGCTTPAPESVPSYPVLRPVVSEAAIPVESFTPVASDGQRGEGFLRKPPGEGPFPAVLMIHGGLPRRSREAIRDYTISTHASRFLEAGYVVAVITYRGREIDPTVQTPETVLDCVAAVEALRTLPFVDPASIVVTGTSGGGDLSLEVAAATEVAAIVPEEPASVLMAGLVVPDSKAARAANYIALYRAEPDHSMFLAKLARIESPILIIQGTHSTHSGINQFNAAVLIPELRAAGKSVEVVTFPGEPHSFSFQSSPSRTPRPAAAQKAFLDADSFIRRHVATQPIPLDPVLVRHEAIRAGSAESAS
jgi:dipeptidyl aminopeptidase/acylaminoacyl peptidase